ncbi:MAG: hypothetical protein JWN53_2400 [Gemmatimonadetes bacterium]|jgi:putative oxidoreductase|nr:hypothetical protein [Gemmatimonadota bacterium]
MFSEIDVAHVLLLVLLVPLLFVIRRRLPARLARHATDPSRPEWHWSRMLVLELTELVLAGTFILVGGAKLIGRADMITLFHDIGVGNWLRYLTGIIEVGGAMLMVVPVATSASALLLGALMIAATLIELLVLHRPPIAAAACMSGHSYIAWARLSRPRPTFVSIRTHRGPRVAAGALLIPACPAAVREPAGATRAARRSRATPPPRPSTGRPG